MCLLRKMFENVHLKTKVETIEDNHNRHAIEDQGCSWTTPLNNCLGLMFFNSNFGFNEECDIFAEMLKCCILRILDENYATYTSFSKTRGKISMNWIQ